jgi:hypothetical protein
MARKPAKNVRGTERYRDERRSDDLPKMHGREWHDHDEPREVESVANSEGADAVVEAESGGDRTGTGRRQTEARAVQSQERRKRTVPPGKGVKRRGPSESAKDGTRMKTGI